MTHETKDDVATILTSILSIEKAGIPMHRLEREYRMVNGTRIPYRQLGFNTLEEFLRSMPNVVRLSRDAVGDWTVHVVVTESTAHVVQMVKGQKSAKSKPMMRPAYRRPVGHSQHGYRSNALLSGVSQSYSSTGRQAFKSFTHQERHREGHAVYQPPHQRNSGQQARQQQSSFGRNQGSSEQPEYNRQKASQDYSRKESYQASRAYQEAPRFQRLRNAGTTKEQSKADPSWGGSSDAPADWEPESRGGNRWGELDNSWTSESPGKRSWEEAGNANARTVVTKDDGGLSVRINQNDHKAEQSTGWQDKEPKPNGFSAQASQLPASPVAENPVPVSVKPPRHMKPIIEPDQQRFDPFRQPIILKPVAPLPQLAPAGHGAEQREATSPESPCPSSPPSLLCSTSPPASPLRLIPPQPCPTLSYEAPAEGPVDRHASVASPLWDNPVRDSKKASPTAEREVISPSCALVNEYARQEGLTALYKCHKSKANKKGPLLWLATLRLGDRNFNSYPDEMPTLEEAKEVAASKAVDALGLKGQGRKPSLPFTPASTDEEVALLVQRIAELVSQKPQGILNEFVPQLYEEHYLERLPSSWLDHVRQTEAVDFERGQSRSILYPRASSSASQNGYVSSRETTSSGSGSSAEAATEEFVDVFVTCVISTDNVWFRFMEYAKDYDELLDAMTTHYETSTAAPSQPIVRDALYATNIDGTWLRVQAVGSPCNGKVECFFVDQGGTSFVDVASLRVLEERFAEFPMQAIQCQLHTLGEYASCEGIVDILGEVLLGKTLVAELIYKEDPISVVMFDTWGPTDVDLNLEVYLRLMAPRLPPVGRIGVAYLSHICGDGLLRLQIPGPGLGILNSCMDAVNNYFKSHSNQVDQVVEGKLYACRYSQDGVFGRAMVTSTNPLPSGQFQVRYVDFGNEEPVFISELRDLDVLGDLTRLPFQVVECYLRGLTKEDGVTWNESLSATLSELAGTNMELLLRVTNPATDSRPALVEACKRLETNRELISVNNALVNMLNRLPQS